METMNRAVFIQANSKQLLGAKLAKYAIERFYGATSPLPVSIIEVEKVPAFREFLGSPYRPGYAPYTFDDLQSFTLTRFMPPELMNYEGRALVIDPDIFALSAIDELFTLNTEGKSVAACRKKDAWDSSVMLLECSHLTHWNIQRILKSLRNNPKTYSEWVEIRNEPVFEIPRIWNSLDTITPETKMLHTTNRITQPWKTGLPIDFTLNPMPKLFGVIPREPIHKLLGKYPTHYRQHPDSTVEKAFFDLARQALEAGAITKEEIAAGIASHDLRPDFFEKI